MNGLAPTPIRKGLRFDIFRRDNFTCRYCGACPPGVVLEIDHVTPRVDGGTNDPLNLVTSCGDCNRGKSRKRLDLTSAAQPDADLEYLSVQQEIAEIERYQRSLIARAKAQTETVRLFQLLWKDLSGLDWCPSNDVFFGLIAKYELEIIELAVRDVAPKVGGGYLGKATNLDYGHLHAVARNTRLEY